MKNSPNSGLAFTLVTMIFFSMLTILPAYAANVTEIYLVPSANDFTLATISPSFRWNVTAWVKNIPAFNGPLASRRR